MENQSLILYSHEQGSDISYTKVNNSSGKYFLIKNAREKLSRELFMVQKARYSTDTEWLLSSCFSSKNF